MSISASAASASAPRRGRAQSRLVLRATGPKAPSVNIGDEVILKDPDILGGTPVFRGTRVPFQAVGGSTPPSSTNFPKTIPPDVIDPLSSRWDRPSPFSGLSSLAGSDDRRQKAIVCPTAHRDATMSVMKLTFWGAAGTVTGSMHLLENDGKRYLLDCGQSQQSFPD